MKWLAVLLVMSGAAHADWQYTKWGMSPDEVVSASDGMVKRGGKSEYGVFAVGSHKLTSGTILPVEFTFRNNKLVGVNIKLETPQNYGEVFALIKQTYGEPIYKQSNISSCRSELIEWRSEKANQFIRLNTFQCGSQPSIDGVGFYPAYQPGEAGL